jgi:ribosomal-protein-alanine N-acetyltransferase
MNPDVTEAVKAAGRALPELETERLVLRALRPDDAEAMFEYAGAPDSPYVIFTAHKTIEESRKVIADVSTATAEGKMLMWGVTLRGEGRLVGTSGFGHITARHAQAELGYILHRRLWNQGFATEAVRAVVRFGFETLGLNRIEARCFAPNVASARVMEKNGMTFEGVMREQIFAKGKFQDMREYSILRREWKP